MRPPPGEQLVAAYLADRGLEFERERKVGSRRPDFYVHHPVAPFVIEVYDPYVPFPAAGSGFIKRQDFRRAFEERKAQQIAAVRQAGLPYVGVLGPGNAGQEIDIAALAATMFGELGFVFGVGPDAPSSGRQWD